MTKEPESAGQSKMHHIQEGSKTKPTNKVLQMETLRPLHCKLKNHCGHIFFMSDLNVN